jgi:hypothetical protein
MLSRRIRIDTLLEKEDRCSPGGYGEGVSIPSWGDKEDRCSPGG